MKALRIFKVVFCPMAAAVLQFFVLPSKVFASVMALLLLLIAALNLWEAGLLCGRTEPKEPAMQSKAPSERERLAAWMIEHSFSTGHGDTFEDLLKELDWQVKELRGQQRAFLTEQDVTEAYQSAPNWHSVLSSLNYRAIKNAALAQALQPEEKERANGKS